MARDGSVGRATFARVEELTAEGKSKTDAFRQIAEETGKNSATVAAAYYRVAHANGTVKPRRRRRKARVASTAQPATAVRRGRPPATRPSDIDQLAAQLVSNVQALAAAMTQQQAELDETRRRLEGVRSVLG